MATLTFLDLYSNGIGAKGAIALSSYPHLAALKHLRLGQNKLTAKNKSGLLESEHFSPELEARLDAEL